MWLEWIFFVCTIIVIYHHVLFPALLARIGAATAKQPGVKRPQPPNAYPTVTLIVPAHNEAAFIARKIADLDAIEYPRDRLEIVIACDGCTDDTAELAGAAIAGARNSCRFDLRINATNRGKVAILNETIAGTETTIVALSDVSAMLQPGALKYAARYFDNDEIGVVCPSYELDAPGSPGEEAYWRYQVTIKKGEAALGAPMGAHGAFYLFRRKLWQPLEPDTINDDFILPMRIVANGAGAIYAADVVALEAEQSGQAQEFRRRLRIAAGNLQQLIRLIGLANPRRPGLAFAFLSGKALRPLLPFIGLAAMASAVVLAFSGSVLFQGLSAAGLAACAIAVRAIFRRNMKAPKAVLWLAYFIEGHAASLLGSLAYLTGTHRKPWRRAAEAHAQMLPPSYMPLSVRISKRILDILCALAALSLLAVLALPIAIMIRLESRGPIFFRQLRVGRQTEEATELFHMIKFRTMFIDAENRSGPVWATKNDPRITCVGRFLRKTRLDELPQALNVLRGEMSAIGPRPERPSFFRRLESEIPFYIERTYGVRPGITGLAQVNQPYDRDIEDVRRKIMFDHAYSARLTSWWQWFKTDLGVIAATLQVMAMGRGQ